MAGPQGREEVVVEWEEEPREKIEEVETTMTIEEKLLGEETGKILTPDEKILREDEVPIVERVDEVPIVERVDEVPIVERVDEVPIAERVGVVGSLTGIVESLTGIVEVLMVLPVEQEVSVDVRRIIAVATVLRIWEMRKTSPHSEEIEKEKTCIGGLL